MDVVAGNTVCFGPFKLDLKAGELYQDGRKIRLQEQPFQVLKMLLQHPGEVVSREEIKKKLWPNDTVVEFDHSINAAIKKLRMALGDSAEEPHYVQTGGQCFGAPPPTRQSPRCKSAAEARSAVGAACRILKQLGV